MKYFYQVRESFWDAHPQFKDDYRKTWRQNKYSCDIRVSFVAYVDMLCRDGQISESLASRVIL